MAKITVKYEDSNDQQFGKKYYDDIWGTVHRHDYCEFLAQQLINQYHPKSVLDIGTGCGYLVKVLRDRGIEAWGLEVSDYAIANSCDPEYVRKGDVRDIPFANRQFDLVHSQGLWGYFPEEDVAKAWQECLRVGHRQHHNYDYDDNDPTHKYVLIKSKEWWESRLRVPKVLVACPTHEVKEYAFQRWIDNVKNLTYPNYEVLVVDNSPNEDYLKRWGDKIPMKHIEVTQDPQKMGVRICQSMAVIRQHFLEGDFDWWMNIEADNIPPSDVIETLLKYGHVADWTSHCYPAWPGSGTLEQGIGCSLLSRRLMEDFDWSKASDSPDAELWDFAKPKIRTDNKYRTVELWNVMKVEHLKEGY